MLPKETTSQPRPKLGLYQPSESESTPHAEPSADFCLTEVFERHLLPEHFLHAKPRHVKQFWESLKLWRSYTGDPPIREVMRSTCATFVRALKDRPGRDAIKVSDATVRKHCIAIQTLLDLVGPRSRHQPAALGLIPDPPLLAKPAVIVSDVEDVFTLTEIGRLLESAAAGRIDSVVSTEWWEALLICAYNTALRRETLLKLRWEWRYEDELGAWFRCPAGAVKKGRAFDVFLNSAVIEALGWIGPHKEGIVFPWRNHETWLHRKQQRICKAAGLPENRCFGFHALRKACANEVERINPLAVPYVLGHSQRNVTRDHYLQRRRIVSATLRELPQPVWARREKRQRYLFS